MLHVFLEHMHIGEKQTAKIWRKICQNMKEEWSRQISVTQLFCISELTRTNLFLSMYLWAKSKHGSFLFGETTCKNKYAKGHMKNPREFLVLNSSKSALLWAPRSSQDPLIFHKVKQYKGSFQAIILNPV